jgi:cell wall-associated NlpC family hydrolase
MVGSVLDDGGRGIAEAVLGAGCMLLVMLAVAIIVPVAVVVGLLDGVAASPGTAGLQMVTSAMSQAASAPRHVQNPPVVSPEPSSQPVEVARRYLGVPYVFGGSDPTVGLDCSGLVQLVFRQLGIGLPRTAQQQFDATPRIPRDQLQPGDLVFFARTYADPHDWITHVGIYIGNGQQINAPTEGQVVSIQPVFTGFWGDHFVSGGRPAGR